MHSEEAAFNLLASPNGCKALGDAVKGNCRVMCALPPVQQDLTRRVTGRESELPSSSEEVFVELLHRPLAIFPQLGKIIVQLLLLPAAALYPPLQGEEYIAYPPRFRYGRLSCKRSSSSS